MQYKVVVGQAWRSLLGKSKDSSTTPTKGLLIYVEVRLLRFARDDGNWSFSTSFKERSKKC